MLSSPRLRLSFALALAVLGCSGAESGEPAEPALPELPWARVAFPEIVVPADNPGTPEKLELGRLLFYDPVLGGDRATACVTCHSEIWGMSDGLPVSVGVDGEGAVGPGRTGPNLTTRNSQTLWNVAYRASLFWDGRTQSLEAQALEPLRAPAELGLEPSEAVLRLREIEAYRALFAAAFPEEAEPISEATLAKALASFQRSMVSERAPYDRYAAGDLGALSADAILGMQAFADAGCPSCHTPPLFESEQYARRVESLDEGRAAVTGEPSELGAFRVPTLRNLRETGPYFHDGSVASLEEAVALEARRSAERGEGAALADEDVARISVFLRKGLVDRTHEPARPREVPSGLDVPLDGFRVPR